MEEENAGEMGKNRKLKKSKRKSENKEIKKGGDRERGEEGRN